MKGLALYVTFFFSTLTLKKEFRGLQTALNYLSFWHFLYRVLPVIQFRQMTFMSLKRASFTIINCDQSSIYVFYFCSQTATLYWEMRRFRRSIRLSIAPMGFASWQDLRERKSCRRVALASFFMGRKRRRKKRPWSTRVSRARRNWRWRLSFTRRAVSSPMRYPMTGCERSRYYYASVI